jgi:hypothetical protein
MVPVESSVTAKSNSTEAFGGDIDVFTDMMKTGREKRAPVRAVDRELRCRIIGYRAAGRRFPWDLPRCGPIVRAIL